jgi:hypothetical protein
LQTVFTAEVHLAEVKVLREEPTVNKGISITFQVGTRIPVILSKEVQNLKPL